MFVLFLCMGSVYKIFCAYLQLRIYLFLLILAIQEINKLNSTEITMKTAPVININRHVGIDIQFNHKTIYLLRSTNNCLHWMFYVGT